LSYAPPEKVKDLIESLRKEAVEIEKSCIDICFHMKGVTFNEAWGMSPHQRSTIVQYINQVYKDRAEAASGKKSM